MINKCSYDRKEPAEYEIFDGNENLYTCEKHYKIRLSTLLSLAARGKITQDIKISKKKELGFTFDKEESLKINVIIANLTKKEKKNLAKSIHRKDYGAEVLNQYSFFWITNPKKI